MNSVRRRCGRAQCGGTAREGGRYCRACFAAASRNSHERHRRERNARRRDRSAERDAAARARDCARAKLYVAIARGKIQKSACTVCGRSEVTAFIADPARWREVVWFCREDRPEKPFAAKVVKVSPPQASFIGFAMAAAASWGAALVDMCCAAYEGSARMLLSSLGVWRL